MSKTHELLSRRPFDLYQLHLFRLVAESGSFTRAAQITGLTQSAITRQIQSIEQQLGLSLLTRTTRSVVTTAAGKFLLQESAPVLGDVDVLLRRLKEEYADAPREVRVGVSRSVSLAYLPGFFSANVRQGPTVISRVTHESSQTILASLESDTLDIGVLLPPARLSERLRITHRFRDAFSSGRLGTDWLVLIRTSLRLEASALFGGPVTGGFGSIFAKVRPAGMYTHWQFGGRNSPWVVAVRPDEGLTWPLVVEAIRARANEVPSTKLYGLSSAAASLFDWLRKLPSSEFELGLSPVVP